jgi:uncharacterized protein (TIGR02145 family)
MNRVFYLFFILLLNTNLLAQNVGIGTTTPTNKLSVAGNADVSGSMGIGITLPATSAKVDISSTTQGFLPPRMTYAQRNAIISPATGLIIFCTDCANGEMQYYNGSNWMQMTVLLGSVPFVAPTITTTTVSSITTSTATAGGNINSDGGALVTSRGVCWSALPNPTINLSTKTSDGVGTGVFVSNITSLLPNTTYHVRAYATNSVGTTYGGDSTFTTAQTFANLPSVTICSQIWTSKNLDVSTYRNGDNIPQVTDPSVWHSLTTGAWCWYNNDSATFASTYGKLYNWYAVNDPRGLAPQGWHVPNDAEWSTLSTCLGGDAVAGGKMKETGTAHWTSPNTGAVNSSGFAGLPYAFRLYSGTFNFLGLYGYFWSSTQYNATDTWCRFLSYNSIDLGRDLNSMTDGLSVRCIRD